MTVNNDSRFSGRPADEKRALHRDNNMHVIAEPYIHTYIQIAEIACAWFGRPADEKRPIGRRELAARLCELTEEECIGMVEV